MHSLGPLSLSTDAQKLQTSSPLEKWVTVALAVGIAAGILLTAAGISSILLSQSAFASSSVAQAASQLLGDQFITNLSMAGGPALSICCLFGSVVWMYNAKREKVIEKTVLKMVEEPPFFTQLPLPSRPKLFIDDATTALLPLLTNYRDNDIVSKEDGDKIKAMIEAKKVDEVKQRINSLFADQLPQLHRDGLNDYVQQITNEYSTKSGEMGGDQIGQIAIACNKREDQWKKTYDYISLITASTLGIYSTFAFELTRQSCSKTAVIGYYEQLYEQLYDLNCMANLSAILPQ